MPLNPEQIFSQSALLEEILNIVQLQRPPARQGSASEQLYFFVLSCLFREVLTEFYPGSFKLPPEYQSSPHWQKLHPLQQNRVKTILNKLEDSGLCLLADNPSMGKVLMALAVIKYYELKQARILVLSQSKSKASWLTHRTQLNSGLFAKDPLGYELLCYEDLQDPAFEESRDRHYDLVVMDQTQACCTPELIQRIQPPRLPFLGQASAAGKPPRLLLLSAPFAHTPWPQLQSQLKLIYQLRDPARLRELEASLITDSQLNLEGLRQLDKISLACTAKELEALNLARVFPQELPLLSPQYSLTYQPQLLNFQELACLLKQLKLAVYTPISYLLPSCWYRYSPFYALLEHRGQIWQIQQEQSLQLSLRFELLKRLESSAFALQLSLQEMAQHYQRSLEQIKEFKQSGSAALAYFIPLTARFMLQEQGSSLAEAPAEAAQIQIHLNDLALLSWEQDLQADLDLIESLLTEITRMLAKDDAKLQLLQEQIEQKLAHPINRGNRKLLIFTAFADTASYLYAQLAQLLLEKYKLQSAKITESAAAASTLPTSLSCPESLSLQDVLNLFAPEAQTKHLALSDSSLALDVLFTTDALAEMHNLCDCDYLINYDIQWDPFKLQQRLACIKQAGSPNSRIQMVNYWPALSLDEYVYLAESYLQLNTFSAEAAYYRSQLRQALKPGPQTPETGPAPWLKQLSLQDYKLDLLRYLSTETRLSSPAQGVYAVVKANPAAGLKPGLLFMLYSPQPDTPPQAATAPYYLIQISYQGKIIAQYSEIQQLLSTLRTACASQDAAPVVLPDRQELLSYALLLEKAIGSVLRYQNAKGIFNSQTADSPLYPTNKAEHFTLLAMLIIQKNQPADV